MNSVLKKLISKDERIPTYLGIALIVGIFLLLLSGPLFRRGQTEALREAQIPAGEPIYAAAPIMAAHPDQVYEEALERRLEEALALVDGVGQVRVMVSFAQGRETIFAVDRNASTSTTQEQDAQGGTRYQSSQQAQDSTLIITDRTGYDRPLVIKETPPVIGGVMIIAEGGDNVLVRDALIRATSTLLGIDINRVHVMRMKA